MWETKKHIRNKEGGVFNRIPGLSGFFTLILRFSLAIALFFIAALLISGAGVIVEDGALNVSNNLVVNGTAYFGNQADIGNDGTYDSKKLWFNTGTPATYNEHSIWIDNGYLLLYDEKNNDWSAKTSSSQFFIKGNTGIGTAVAPVNKLEVEGSVAVGAGYAGAYKMAPANGMIIEGNVSIGTTDSTHKLHVVGSQNLTGTLYYGALQAQSPHAFINNDAKTRTEICLVADDGVVVLQYLKNIEGTYQWAFEPNAEKCLNKEITIDLIIEYEEVYDEELGHNVAVEKSRTEIKKKVFQQQQLLSK